MATRKTVHPHYLIECDTSAEMLAYSFAVSDIGNATVVCHETGYKYSVISSGAGATSLTVLDDSLYEMDIPLNTFRECDASGDVGAAAAIGGVLASDTTPILRADAAESLEIAWATGNVDPIVSSFSTPSRMDITRACYIDVYVSSGTTNAATMTVETSDNGTAKVADTATATATATLHKATATIAAGDIAADAIVTLGITPANAHATDAYILKGVKFRCFKK